MLSSLTPRQFRIVIALLIVLGVVLIGLIAVQLTGGEDAGAPTTLIDASSTTSSVTTAPPVTTSTAVPTTTSTTLAATTTSEATTTTVAETTTTSEATTTTTTQQAELILERDGLDAVDFGSSPQATITVVTTILGQDPDVDTGWIDAFDNPYGTCPPPLIRGVEWGILTALFTQAETEFASSGTEHFFAYTYAPQPSKPGAGPHGLVTAEGIGLGSTRTQLEGAYGDRVEIFDNEVFGTFFQIDADFASDEALGGVMTGPQATAQVASILGGLGCGE